MKFVFNKAPKPNEVDSTNWMDWVWQLRSSLKTEQDFANYFELTPGESSVFQKKRNQSKLQTFITNQVGADQATITTNIENSINAAGGGGAGGGAEIFNIRTTPYYASLASKTNPLDPLRRILVPHEKELFDVKQAQLDPLGERKKSNHPTSRIIHRYSDRVLFLITDICSVYCRYCTRKHFTGSEQAFIKPNEYNEALNYIKKTTGIREVILSGGDPLTVSDSQLDRVLTDLRKIEHIEIIRIGTRMPVVAPMRVTDELVKIIKMAKPVFVMTHFNHPRELTQEAALSVEKLVDNGIPVMNQMVLLNGVNNHAAIVQALSRRLLYLRVKPYYMFQCDPSIGTDYLRTSIEDSLEIQKELWGHLSGLAMPTLSLDIPDGGGKVYYAPQFETEASPISRKYKGWDGVSAEYINPESSSLLKPIDYEDYLNEWMEVKNSKKLI